MKNYVYKMKSVLNGWNLWKIESVSFVVVLRIVYRSENNDLHDFN